MAHLGPAPEDFQVDEVPLYAPTGLGDHTFVRVEKRRRSTEEVARVLARAAGVRPGDVGYAGRKDRVGLCTQWLSVPGLDPGRALELEWPGIRVLHAARHPHKLRTGQLRANRFRVAVADVGEADRRAAEERLRALVRLGLPNRFGPQRFGRDGDNARRGLALLSGGPAPRDRRSARFLLSALQAAGFNDVLAERGGAGAPGRPQDPPPTPIDRLERGDVAVVHASGGLFLVEDPDREAPRAEAFEISPTGPLFGSRVIEPGGAVARREREAAERRGVPPGALPAPFARRLRGARRALRVRPEDAHLEPREGGALLCCALPPGSYVSVLLEDLFGPGASRHAAG